MKTDYISKALTFLKVVALSENDEVVLNIVAKARAELDAIEKELLLVELDSLLEPPNDWEDLNDNPELDTWSDGDGQYDWINGGGE